MKKIIVSLVCLIANTTLTMTFQSGRNIYRKPHRPKPIISVTPPPSQRNFKADERASVVRQFVSKSDHPKRPSRETITRDKIEHLDIKAKLNEARAAFIRTHSEHLKAAQHLETTTEEFRKSYQKMLQKYPGLYGNNKALQDDLSTKRQSLIAGIKDVD